MGKSIPGSKTRLANESLVLIQFESCEYLIFMLANWNLKTHMKQSFYPVTSPNARILILGTMPGEESLARQEYYANPRNQFWRIMDELFGISFSAPYAERIARLQENQIALWDVLHSCERIGSLDSAIRNAVPNDFGALLASMPELKAIAFNGKKSAGWFERWVTVDTSGLRKLVLPSTSPAAAMAFEKKLAAWAALKNT
jgi:hypoxanthine-DNA glycosylase